MQTIIDAIEQGHPGLLCREPAIRWQDALPCGSGSVGALVLGHIHREQIVLNHEALWMTSPRQTTPDVSDTVDDLRRLILSGQYQRAQGFLQQQLEQRGFTGGQSDPYHPAFDVQLTTATRGAFGDYRRGLLFETGEASVCWTDGDTCYQRRTFVSREDDTVVIDIRREGPAPVDCQLTLEPHGLVKGQVMGVRAAEDGEPPLHFETDIEDDRPWILGRYNDGRTYGGVARVVARGGTVRATGGAVRVTGAEAVLVVVKLVVDNPTAEQLKGAARGLEVSVDDYDRLLEGHLRLHRELFNRVTLDLGAKSDERAMVNDDLLARAWDGHVSPALVERMSAYGRYLLIASSRAGGWPANLQGVWNGDYDPAWSSDYHNDENIQMNYWLAPAGNLPEVMLPLFDYYERCMGDYRDNARKLFGCRGIWIPIAQSTQGGLYPGVWLNWTAAAGWLAQHFYDYWLVTGDREFLRERAVPFMKETAAFYEDFLVEDQHGRLMFVPSLSPENVPAIDDGSLATVNATMDVAVAREVLSNLLEACRVLQLDDEPMDTWQAMLEALPEYEVNDDGALKEWLYPGLVDNYHHRHQSHLYPVFPGFELTEEDGRLFEAARVAVEKRLVVGLSSQTGWSLAHMAGIYARLGNGTRALECLELVLRVCTGVNLFTYHNDWRSQGVTMFWGHGTPPPFQIDAGLGFTAAVQEMLLFSRPGLVKLLPALPEAWPRGRVTGLRCRGGITVSIRWNLEAGCMTTTLTADADCEVLVKWPFEVTGLEATGTVSVQPDPRGAAYRRIGLKVGEEVVLKANR